MKEARYFYVPNAAVETELPAEEAVHAIRVLRLKEGDEMFLMDGEGCFYKAEVALVSSKKCLYTIKETLNKNLFGVERFILLLLQQKIWGV